MRWYDYAINPVTGCACVLLTIIFCDHIQIPRPWGIFLGVLSFIIYCTILYAAVWIKQRLSKF